MGLTTIDPHSHKSADRNLQNPYPIVSKIQPFEYVKIFKEMYGHLDTVQTQHPDGHTFLCQ